MSCTYPKEIIKTRLRNIRRKLEHPKTFWLNEDDKLYLLNKIEELKKNLLPENADNIIAIYEKELAKEREENEAMENEADTKRGLLDR